MWIKLCICAVRWGCCFSLYRLDVHQWETVSSGYAGLSDWKCFKRLDVPLSNCFQCAGSVLSAACVHSPWPGRLSAWRVRLRWVVCCSERGGGMGHLQRCCWWLPSGVNGLWGPGVTATHCYPLPHANWVAHFFLTDVVKHELEWECTIDTQEDNHIGTVQRRLWMVWHCCRLWVVSVHGNINRSSCLF